MNFLFGGIFGFLIGIINFNFKPNENSKKNWVQLIFPYLLDLLKGLLIVLITKFIFNYQFFEIIIALILGIISNSFFKGLKFQISESYFMTFGGLLLFIPTINLIWLVIWIIAYIYKRSLYFGLISSTLLTGLLCITSSDILNNEYWFTSPIAESNIQFQFFIGGLFALTLISEIKHIKTYFRRNNLKGN